jgi:hypothetical protein
MTSKVAMNLANARKAQKKFNQFLADGAMVFMVWLFKHSLKICTLKL